MSLWDQIKEQVSGFNRGTWGTLDSLFQAPGQALGVPTAAPFKAMGAYHDPGAYAPSGGVFGEAAGSMVGTPAKTLPMLLAAGLTAVPELSQSIMDKNQKDLDVITEKQRVLRQSGAPRDAVERQIAALEQEAERIRAAQRAAFAQLVKAVPK